MATQKEQGGEVARRYQPGEVATPGAGRVGDLGLFDGFIAEVQFRDDDENATYRAMLADLLSAKSVEEVLTPPEVEDANALVGVPLRVTGWSRVDSDYDQGASQYGSIRAVREDTAEVVVVNTGWQFLLGQLLMWTLFEEAARARAEDRDPDLVVPRRIVFDVPRRVTIIAANHANRFGKTPLRLKLLS